MIKSEVFQSLIGFKINWNVAPYPISGLGKLKFQSLIGFKINWNATW